MWGERRLNRCLVSSYDGEKAIQLDATFYGQREEKNTNTFITLVWRDTKDRWYKKVNIVTTIRKEVSWSVGLLDSSIVSLYRQKTFN